MQICVLPQLRGEDGGAWVKDRLYNCPNCGAPIGYSPVCQYCGTRLDWLPFKEVDILIHPKHINFITGEVSAFVGNEVPQEIRDRVAFRGLVERLAENVAKVCRIRRDDDYIRCGKIYKAQVAFADLSVDGKKMEVQDA